MGTIGAILKKSILDIWEEMLYLILFNVICFIGIGLILPAPLVLFGLFGVAYEIGEGKGISLATFWSYARSTWKPAYRWAGLNVVLWLVWGINLNFYNGFDAPWALALRMFLLALGAIWATLQLLALGMYPRLKRPAFTLALRNAAALVGLQPFVALVPAVILLLLTGLSLLFPATALAAAFSVVAVVTNRTVQALINRAVELDRVEEG